MPGFASVSVVFVHRTPRCCLIPVSARFDAPFPRRHPQGARPASDELGEKSFSVRGLFCPVLQSPLISISLKTPSICLNDLRPLENTLGLPGLGWLILLRIHTPSWGFSKPMSPTERPPQAPCQRVIPSLPVSHSVSSPCLTVLSLLYVYSLSSRPHCDLVRWYCCQVHGWSPRAKYGDGLRP